MNSAVTCSSPPVESCGSQSPISVVEATYNTSVIYKCNHGYWYNYGIYSVTLTCNATGDWFPTYSPCKG